jgi:hypothetical protein
MTTQPEALRLAELFELESDPESQYRKAAAELRRLHAENEVMRNVANRGGHIAVAMSRIADLEAQRDALLEALKLAWPIIEAEMHKQDCSYGKNFVQTKADRARNIYAKALAAIASVEETK